MKKVLLVFLSFITLNFANCQIFSEDWDDITGWSVLDADGDAFNWQIVPAASLVGSPIESYGNSFYSQSINQLNGASLSPDNFLFSGAINLAGLSGKTHLIFDATMLSSTGLDVENLNVYASITDPFSNMLSLEGDCDAGIIPLISAIVIPSTDANVDKNYMFDITNLHNQTFYLVFRHQNTAMQSGIFLDNIHVVNTNFVESNATGCVGSQFNFTNTSVGGNSNVNVSWDFGNGAGSPATSTSNSEVVTFPAIGSYNVSLLLNGNVAYTRGINVVGTPDPDFTADVTSGCSPLKVTFTPAAPGTGYQFSFSDSTRTDVITGMPTTKTFPDSGTYIVYLTQTIDALCFGTSLDSVVITVFKTPTAGFNATATDLDMYFPLVSFINTSIGAVSYVWDFGDTSINSENLSPEHLFPEKIEGFYDVELEAISANFCTDSITLRIVVEEKITFFIPNAFTPNGDEFNNTFKPRMVSGIDPNTYNLKIYNRWGNLIFESNDPAIGWDGDYGAANGVTDAEIFTYKLKFNSSKNDEVRTITGSVTLLK
jgi:gliding motility-associated-like protein